jgi:hypothetical protein
MFWPRRGSIRVDLWRARKRYRASDRHMERAKGVSDVSVHRNCPLVAPETHITYASIHVTFCGVNSALLDSRASDTLWFDRFRAPYVYGLLPLSPQTTQWKSKCSLLIEQGRRVPAVHVAAPKATVSLSSGDSNKPALMMSDVTVSLSTIMLIMRGNGAAVSCAMGDVVGTVGEWGDE